MYFSYSSIAACAERLITTKPEKPPSKSTKQPMSGFRQVLVIFCTMPEKRISPRVALLRTADTELHKLSNRSSVPNTTGLSCMLMMLTGRVVVC